MSWGELRALTLDKLDKTLASGGANGPDSLLEEEYGGLLYKTLDEAWQTDNLSSFCVTIFDKIYRAMTNRGFYWIDLTEASTVLALREAFVECSNQL